MIDLRSCSVVLLCGLFLGLSQPALAQPARRPPLPPLAPVNRLVLNNLLVLRLNPVGLEDQIRFGLQHRLSEESDGPLWRDTFLFAGIARASTPLYQDRTVGRDSAHLDLQPARGAGVHAALWDVRLPAVLFLAHR